jgi:uracil-DNA glycosylase
VQVPCIGKPEAQLLVISQIDKQIDSDEQAGGPWAGDESQLFDLMMRSIDLNLSQLRVCAVHAYPHTEAGQSSAHVVSDLLTPHTRAVLFFDHNLAVEQSQADYSEMTSSGLPIWRLLHPSQLLIEPQRKRMAWEALKSIRASLSHP